ncbi:hypothetical protein [Streptomyces sp. SYP-A7185]|uniref:hypothetical protein n=1 Tax=Streptomyces sp. SYP-A7185 TaxID=3040076 RepID=UPI0038F7054D
MVQQEQAHGRVGQRPGADGWTVPTRVGNGELGWNHFSGKHNIKKCKVVNAPLNGKPDKVSGARLGYWGYAINGGPPGDDHRRRAVRTKDLRPTLRCERRPENRRHHRLLQGHEQVPQLGQRVTTMDEEIAERQADVTRLLLHHVQAPLTDTLYIRGILPLPAPAEAVRVVTGAANAYTPNRLMAYEIPLRVHDDIVTAHDVRVLV